MIVVSGCPRSGTSLMMKCFIEAMGQNNVIGDKWPMDKKHPDKYLQQCIGHIEEARNPDLRKQIEESKKMNPNGFWETPWTVNGIKWSYPEPDRSKVTKIVSQGLAQSNPVYVDKLIMMVRHPYAVAKSQKDLVLPIPVHTRNKDLGNIDPDMFNHVTVMASKWILNHKPEMITVEFEELISNPKDTLNAVHSFIGHGDWDKAEKEIQPKLQRNEPTKPEIPGDWENALHYYELFKAGKYQEVLDFAKDNEKPREKGFFCTRFGGNVMKDNCTQCKTDRSSMQKLKDQADRRGINWKDKPCLWECGMNLDRDSYTPLTIEESIKNNHWINRQESSESTDKYAEFNLARTQFSTSDIDKSEGMIDAKECPHCEDFDSNKYHLMLKNVNVFDDCFKLEFDINDHKSVRFEMVEDININHVLTQQRNSCLWSKTLPNFLVKYYNTKDGCEETSEKIDLVDVHIYLEKISKTRWYFSVSADGGFDLFASVVSSEEGKCLGTVEFLNELTKDTPFRETDSILQNQSAKRVFSTGRAIGYEGIALVSCGTED